MRTHRTGLEHPPPLVSPRRSSSPALAAGQADARPDAAAARRSATLRCPGRRGHPAFEGAERRDCALILGARLITYRERAPPRGHAPSAESALEDCRTLRACPAPTSILHGSREKPCTNFSLTCRVPRTGTYKAGLLIRLRRCPCGRQHLRLVTVRMLYLMFVRLAGWMARQGFPMSRVGGRAGARVGAGGDFGIHSA